jgi:signal transduction histidine kinase
MAAAGHEQVGGAGVNATYRGQDRRAPASWSSPVGRPFVLAILVLAAAVASIVSVAAQDLVPSGVDLRALDAVLWTAGAVLALVAGFVSCLRWRMVGDASSLRVGVALVLFCALIVVIDLVPFVVRTVRTATFLGHLDAAMTLMVFAVFVVAVVAPPIDARVSAARVSAAVATGVVLLVAVQYAVPLTAFRHRRALTGDPVDIAATVTVVALLALLATIAVARGILRGSWLWAWLGLTLVAIASAWVLGAISTASHDAWTTGALVLVVIGLLFAVHGVAQELKRAYIDQRSRLFDTQVTAEASEARRRAESQVREERAHQARSAVLAIQFAVRGLMVNYGGLGLDTQASLRDAVQAEIELLRRLVDSDEARLAPAAFDVATTVGPVVVCQRAAGLEVEAAIPAGLCAVGRAAEVAEVVQSLLENARRHAPGSPVTVSARRRGNHVELRVEDRGPGVAPSSHDRIFRRGVTSRVDGTGLGLYVARRLLREQGGDVSVEDRVGGGASFVVVLPAASLVTRPWPGDELAHEVHDVGRPVDTNPFELAGGEQ